MTYRDSYNIGSGVMPILHISKYQKNNLKDKHKMEINLILRAIINKLRVVLLPTKQEKEVKRYFADGGDEVFRYDFDLNNESLVLDFGGFKGQWASDIYSRYNCRILVFEPVKLYM